MKNVIKMTSIGLMAMAIAGAQFNNLHAQDAAAPSAEESAGRSDRALPFHGKLKAVDKEAATVTVGSRTFQLTSQTQYLQGSLEDAKLGEKVGGSYWKEANGTLTVKSIRFGPKAAGEMKEKASAE